MAQWLLGTGNRANQTPKPAAGLRISTSLQGLPLAILLGGRNRIGCNLIDYVDFAAIAQDSGGGKGVGAGGGKGTAGTSFKYQAAIIAALCEGPIASIDAVWNNKTKQTLASLNLTAFLGTYGQAAWGYMTTAHADRALAYRGIAYAAAGPLQLGDAPELPNLSFEATAVDANAIAGAPDADPRDCIVTYLTDEHFGAGFPAELLDTLGDYSTYCRAAGLVVSPVISSQGEASTFLADLLEATNSEAVWTGGLLTVVPYGDEEIAANGSHFVPVTAPAYDLTNDHFIADKNEPPVKIGRKAQSEQLNSIAVEYADRAAAPNPDTGDSRSYDPAVVEAKDDAAIAAFGLRKADKKQNPFFCLGSAAQQSANLRLGRQQIRNTFSFTVGRRFIRLRPMDIVTLTEPGVSLDRYPVRIKSIEENQDRSLSMTAEDYLIGSAAAPLYGDEANAGHVPDYNADPGSINPPLIFEPTNELANGLEARIAVSGVDADIWGGADVYVSYDGETYQHLDRITGAARMGVLTAPLASYPANPAGQTIDETHTLSVDLSQSRGALQSGSQTDAVSLNTLCYIEGGEFIAYKTATLTGPNAYDLTYLVRGAYGTESEIATWLAGRKFVRVDGSLLRVPFTQDRIGATVYFKFASFNIWGGGQQSLADVGAFAYTIEGTALASPMPNVKNLRAAYVDSQIKIDFDEVKDNRPPRYQFWEGDTFDTALVVGDIAHPPFVPSGNGTYWIKAYSTPLPGLKVYSEDPTSILLAGAILEKNVIATYDEKALGWTGTLVGDIEVSGGSVRTTTPGPVIAYYEEPGAHWIDVGYVRPTRLGASFKATGAPANQNILDITDFLNTDDILGASAVNFVDAWVEVAVATDTGSDIFEPADIFAPADVFAATPTWGPWVKFTPGVYLGRYFRRRLAIQAVNDTAVAYGLEFSTSADVEDRVDHQTNVTVPDTGLTITHTPDGSATAVPFKGGPNGSALPHIQVTIANPSDGDRVVISGETLAAATITILNGATPVARLANIYIQGW